MDEVRPPAVDSAVFETNLSALSRGHAALAASLRQAQGPDGVAAATARDGSVSYYWHDGVRGRWLGRTSMPELRAAALVEAFQHGGSNVLLAGIGAGREARRLLDGMAAFQAVFVVEEDAWAAAAALRLNDFSVAIASGRLLLFVGPTAWDACRDFLIEHDGYLPPDRVLGWPWLTPEDIARLHDRVAALHRAVAAGRATRESAVPPFPAVPCRDDGILLVAGAPEPERVRLAEAWATAARACGRRATTYALCDPARVSPPAVERGLGAFGPRLVILLDSVPRSLHFTLPACPVLALVSRAGALPADVGAPWPADTWLGVATASQEREAIARGIPPERVVRVPPAATLTVTGIAARGRRVAIVGDVWDDSPESAGLHLPTHRRLWEAARQQLSADRALRLGDASMTALTSAERSLGIQIESEPVRAGLVDRIERRLLPVARRRGCLAALARHARDIDAIGAGWPRDTSLRTRLSPDGSLPAGDAECGLCVFPDLSDRMATRLLDAVATGALCAVPRGQWEQLDAGLEGVLTPGEHLVLFGTPDELSRLTREFAGRSGRLELIAAAGRAHVEALHTARHRLEAILSQVPPPARTS